MIRPLTIVTCLMACGSGLYLYQEKHEVQLLDRTIERTVHDTEALREQSRLLAAEWTMLNDPERLRQFSDSYLSLKTISPSQFTSVADLDSRLPAVQPEVPAHPDEPGPVAAADDSTDADDPAPAADAAPAAAAAVVEDDLPVPPIPAAPRPASVASAARPAGTRPVDRSPAARAVVSDSQPRTAAVTDARPSDQRPPDQRLLEQRAAEQRAYDQRAGERRTAARVADARRDVRTQAAPPPSSDRPRGAAAGGACQWAGWWTACDHTGPRADGGCVGPIRWLAAWHGARIDAAGAAADPGERHL